MRISRIVVAILASLCLGPAVAVEPDARRLAEELLTLTNAEKTLADLRAQVGQMMTAQLRSTELPDQMREKETAYQQQILDAVFDEMAFSKLKPDYIEVYASTFTTEELSGLVAFYKSPAGRAFADKLPVLTKRMLEVSQTRIQALAPRIKKISDDFVADMKKTATAK